jgi:hypothetical protein
LPTTGAQFGVEIALISYVRRRDCSFTIISLGGLVVVFLIGVSNTDKANAAWLRLGQEHRLAARNQARSRPAQRSLLTAETILEAEQLLSNLGYWTGSVDGKFDEGSRHALIAFQKVEDRPRTGRITFDELQALRTARRVLPLDSKYAHIEVDLARQVLFTVDSSGVVSRILPVSTGNGELFTSEGWTRRAVTPSGRFIITLKVAGWRKSPLGLLYYPNYIVGGIAIHGNPSVPVHPASHGCIRIPMFAAKQFSEINPIGTVVLVYSSDFV